jgi:hypothetical protein
VAPYPADVDNVPAGKAADLVPYDPFSPRGKGAGTPTARDWSLRTLDARFEALEHRLAELERRFGEMERRFARSNREPSTRARRYPQGDALRVAPEDAPAAKTP